jgi:hypothetical protein
LSEKENDETQKGKMLFQSGFFCRRTGFAQLRKTVRFGFGFKKKNIGFGAEQTGPE